MEPEGSFLTAGVAAVRGVGVQIGYVTARNFYTREITGIVDLLPLLDRARGSVQLAVTVGGAIRLLGFERTIGNAPYRGYDLDIGFRIGPGLSYAENESRAMRDRRFNLFLEPYLRFTMASGTRRVLYLEAGIIRPHIRLGWWIR